MGISEANRSNQKCESCVSTSPLRGMPNIPPDYREYIAAADLASVQTLAQSCVDAINGVGHSTYVRKPGFDFYNAPISGASHDYAYSRHIVNPAKGKILGFIVEWGDKPQPVWPDMQKVITDVTSGLVGFCLSAAAT